MPAQLMRQNLPMHRAGQHRKTCQSIGLVNTIGAEQHYVDIDFCVIVGGEQRTKHTVNQTARQNLIVRGFTLALGETARKTTCSGILLSVVNLQRHEIGSGNCIFWELHLLRHKQ